MNTAVGPITGVTESSGVFTITLAAHGLQTGEFVWIEILEGDLAKLNTLFKVTRLSSSTFSISTSVGFGGRQTLGPNAFSTSSNSLVRLVMSHTDARSITNFGNDYWFKHPTLASSTVTLFDPVPIDALQAAQAANTMFLSIRGRRPSKIVRAGDTDWSWVYFTPTSNPWSTSDLNDNPSVVGFHDQRLFFAATNDQPLTIWGSKLGDFEDFTQGSNFDDSVEFTIATKRIHNIQWIESADKFMMVGTKGTNLRVGGGVIEEPITPTNISSKPIDFKGSFLAQPSLVDKSVIFIQTGQRKIISLLYDINIDGVKPFDLTRFVRHLTEVGIKFIEPQIADQNIIWAIREDGKLLTFTFDQDENIFAWSQIDTKDDDTYESMAVIPKPIGYDELWVVARRDIDGTTEDYIEIMQDYPEFPRQIDFFINDEEADLENWRRQVWERQKRAIFLDSALVYDGTLQGTDAGATMTPGAVTGEGITFTASANVFVSGDVGREIWSKETNGRATIKTFTSATSVDCDITVDFDNTNVIPAGDWYLTTDTVTGLTHLDGETVQIVADGAVHADKAVASGSLTLDIQASYVVVGFKYTGFIKVMPLEGGGIIGSAQGLLQNIGQAFVRFLDTLGVKFGTDLYNLEKIPFRSTDDLFNRISQPFSGYKQITWPEGWEREKQVVIFQDNPLPCTIQAIHAEIDSSE